MNKKVYVLPSTHWDREWYSTFQQFRFRLVRMMDDLLDTMRDNPNYRYFYLDGQTVVLEDYLEIRPERREELAGLLAAGRLRIGPWYCMPDSMLVNGEGLIRNLLRGGEICREYAASPPNNGYVCDIFGHNSQLPQIFSQFGITTATMLRGLGDFKSDMFRWVGADGTECAAFKLDDDYSYSNFYFVMRWHFDILNGNAPTRPTDDEYVERMRRYLSDGQVKFATDCILMIDGVDHSDILPDLPRILEVLNRRIEGYEFVLSDFDDFIRQALSEKPELPKFSGPLYRVGRTGMNNGLLKNVLSSLPQIKRHNDALESGLALVAEPLDLFCKLWDANANDYDYRTFYPRTNYFKRIWQWVLLNQPHDSICGCSITPVHEDNLNRYKQANEMLEAVRRELTETLARRLDTRGRGKDGCILAFNTCGCPAEGVCELELELPGGEYEPNLRLYGENGEELDYTIVSARKEYKRLYPLRKLIDMPLHTRYTLYTRLHAPAFGCARLTYDFLHSSHDPGEWRYREECLPRRFVGSMKVDGRTADNGVYRVTAEPCGTLCVEVKATGRKYRGLMALEDGGDIGDGWIYRKPPFDWQLTQSGRAEIGFGADTPDVLELKLAVGLTVPGRVAEDWDRRGGQVTELRVVSTVTILRGDPVLRVRTELTNTALHHRLRVLFPTDMETEVFRTMTPFDVCEWPIQRDNGSNHEYESGVVPNQGLVNAAQGGDSLSLYTRGIYECALLDRPDRPLALTLFRSFAHEHASFGARIGRLENAALEFDYAMDFSSLTNSEMVKRANFFKTGLTCVACKRHEGLAPDEPVELTGGAVLSSLQSEFVSEDGDCGSLVRLYDVDGGSRGGLSFAKPIQEAWEITAAGRKLRRAEHAGDKLGYRLGAKKMITFLVKFN